MGGSTNMTETNMTNGITNTMGERLFRCFRWGKNTLVRKWKVK